MPRTCSLPRSQYLLLLLTLSSPTPTLMPSTPDSHSPPKYRLTSTLLGPHQRSTQLRGSAQHPPHRCQHISTTTRYGSISLFVYLFHLRIFLPPVQLFYCSLYTSIEHLFPRSTPHTCTQTHAPHSCVDCHWFMRGGGRIVGLGYLKWEPHSR